MYKFTVHSNGLVRASGQTIAINALEPPKKIHSGVVCRVYLDLYCSNLHVHRKLGDLPNEYNSFWDRIEKCSYDHVICLL